jgi:hypothetical protein
MGLIHTHVWEETERIVTPPGSHSKMNGSSDAVERILWGITSIVLTCKQCGDKKVVEVKGHV